MGSIFRFASITKPITAAALMILIDEGRIALDDAVTTWLPELSSLSVVRTPSSPVDDVVPAARPISVLDVLTSRAGYGFASDFSLPAVQALFTVQTDGREVQLRPHPDEWTAALSRIPLLYQPGEAWLRRSIQAQLGRSPPAARPPSVRRARPLLERLLGQDLYEGGAPGRHREGVREQRSAGRDLAHHHA